MVILDTNVVAELMKPSPEPAVVSWLNHQETSSGVGIVNPFEAG
jgi:predicted nucleic acid-binding protein